jgi:rod shape-determining protein MreC
MLIGKNRLIRRRVIIGLLLAASLTLLTLSFREGSAGVTGSIRRSTLSITAPLSDVVHRITQPVADAWGWTTGLVDARQENEQLKKELERQGAAGVQIQALQQQLQKDEQLLNFVNSRGAAAYDYIGASVIAQAPNDYNRTITINVGSADGIAVNDPVVAPYGDGAGLMGRVESVTANAATVMLILDQNSAVYASIQGGTAKGLLVPSSGDPSQLNMLFVGVDESVDVGQAVLTANYRSNRLEPLLPRDIPVGKVTSVSQSDANSDKTIQVTPFVDFQDLTDVLVLKQKGAS